MRASYHIRLRRGLLVAGPKTLLMGVLNVTPDSFYHGSRHWAWGDAVSCGQKLIQEGADILDIGGESTRPNAVAVDAAEETARILPVIRALVEMDKVPISVDTYKSEVAREALQAGAQIVNDISGLRFDPNLAAVAKEAGAVVVLSHIRGKPESMHRLPPAADILSEVVADLRGSIDRALEAGIGMDQILIDPGIGFGKTATESVFLMNHLGELASLGFPVLVGPSRKSFIGKILDQSRPEERLLGTAASVACSILRGACVVRVHDVAAMRQVVKVADAIVNDRVIE